MRIPFLTACLVLFFASAQAQTKLPETNVSYSPAQDFTKKLNHKDSLSPKKWSLIKYSSISTGITFSKAGSVSFVSAPMSLQLNRRLSSNWYAFANVSVAPAYVNFNRGFLNSYSKSSRSNDFYNLKNTALYSSASLGLMYVNEAKTFSVSGSFNVEKNNYPLFPYQPFNTLNTFRPGMLTPANR